MVDLDVEVFRTEEPENNRMEHVLMRCGASLARMSRRGFLGSATYVGLQHEGPCIPIHPGPLHLGAAGASGCWEGSASCEHPTTIHNPFTGKKHTQGLAGLVYFPIKLIGLSLFRTKPAKARPFPSPLCVSLRGLGLERVRHRQAERFRGRFCRRRGDTSPIQFYPI